MVQRAIREIDPRIKLVWVLSYGILFFSDRFCLVIFSLLVAICAYVSSEARRSTYAQGVVIMLVFLGVFVGAIGIEASVAGDVGVLLNGLILTFKWLAIVLSSVAFFVVTRPSDVVLALRSFRIPAVASFALGMGFRFLPVISEEFQQVLLAQRSRGLDSGRGLESLARLPLIVRSVSVPLLRVLFGRIDRTWIALSLKGVTVENYAPRRPLKFSKPDLAVVVYCVSILVMALLP